MPPSVSEIFCIAVPIGRLSMLPLRGCITFFYIVLQSLHPFGIDRDLHGIKSHPSFREAKHIAEYFTTKFTNPRKLSGIHRAPQSFFSQKNQDGPRKLLQLRRSETFLAPKVQEEIQASEKRNILLKRIFFYHNVHKATQSFLSKKLEGRNSNLKKNHTSNFKISLKSS